MGIIPTRVGTSCLAPYDYYAPSGSSPRVWGQAIPLTIMLLTARIIPTRVGTSVIAEPIGMYMGDHPHACGDKQDNVEETKIRLGSSPRVWGQVIIVRSIVKPSRIIPTRVGTRKIHNDIADTAEDHPHACGDKLHRQAALFLHGGSSPRVWGQVSVAL